MLEGNATSDPNKRAFLFQVATVAFEKGWTLTRRDDTFPVELAAIYDALGRFSEAEWMYQEAFRLDPKNAPIQRSYQTHLENWRQTGIANDTAIESTPR